MIDYLIKGGSVIDGGGSEAEILDIGIEGDRICYLGKGGAVARRVIDAEGLIVTPGFIDTHAHSEFTILADGRAEGKLSQGVTMEINGNCGLSAAPLLGEAFERREADQEEFGIKERWNTFGEYFELIRRRGISINFATLCGHGNVRASVMGYKDDTPTESEMQAMKELLAEALHAGARGLSTGLIYPPGVYSSSSEITGMAEVVASERRGGIYASHMRSEGDGLIESVEETLNIGAGASLPVHISHLKTSGERNWNKIETVLSMIDEAQSKGMQVTCDRYPYIASSTDLDTVMPSWVYAGGLQKELQRLRDSETRSKIRAELIKNTDHYWQGVYISSVSGRGNKWMEGENILDIASRTGRHPADAVLDITIEEDARAGAIFFSMCEENLRRFLSLKYTMIGSDSAVRSCPGPTCSGKPHPRGFGSFARFISKYTKDENIISLPEAIRRLTSLPASVFGLQGRGLIRQGYFADLVIFDYAAIRDEATFTEPFRNAQGIAHVFVNGMLSFSEGNLTETRSGMIV
ncbi:MAG: N-acyl-D-amino-acid deacylase family protein [Dissulfurispiraceae bacterium]|jgi:N-acyl-D-amino-acid deacylase